jgi:hypothetical protein
MATPLPFARPPTSRPRLLGDKLQEIAVRSPKDLAAIEVLADYVLARLPNVVPEPRLKP